MNNNNMDHISDQASTVVFNPTGTQWPSNVTNVQIALSKIGPWATTDTGLPIASLSTAGIIQTCTVDEVKAGVANGKAVTPDVLNQYVLKPHATEAEYGTTKYANATERLDVSNNVTSITPMGLNDVFNRRPSTEAIAGALKVATRAQAEGATDDNVIMTPAKVKFAINALVASYGDATERNKGVVKIATDAEIAAGVANEAMAISPKGFARARGTASAYGTFKMAQDNDMITLADQDKAVTPYILGRNKAATNKFGIVKLATDYSTEGNTALSANANVMFKSGGVFSGDIYRGSQTAGNKYITQAEAANAMPIGSVIMWIGHNMPSGNWAPLDGRWLNKSTYSTLYSIIGNMYGGDANSFALMDMRGMFPRGWDGGRGWPDGGRGLGTSQRCSTEAHQHIGGGLGERLGHGGFMSYFGHTTQWYAGSKGNIDWDNTIYYTSDGRDGWNGERINTAGQIGDETRPHNMAVQFIIKIA